MKACKFCGMHVHSSEQHCPSCGSSVFLHVCENCGTAFDSGFCPNCGVKAGQMKKICPECSTAYFSNACPNCGYMPSRKPAAQKVEQTVVHKHIYLVPDVAPDPEPAPATAPVRKKGRRGEGCGCLTVVIVFFVVLGLITSLRSCRKSSESSSGTAASKAVTVAQSSAAKATKDPSVTAAPTAMPEPDVLAAQQAVDAYYAGLSEAGVTPDPETLTASQKAGLKVRAAQAEAAKKGETAAVSLDVYKAVWKDGRGVTSISYEPDYAGILGYAAVYTEEKLDQNGAFLTTPWEVPAYQPDKQFWAQDGTVPHKTQVVVLGQKLEEKTNKKYTGYVQVIRMDTEEVCWLKVENFITEPYWEKSLSRAVEDGYALATFTQKSNYYPVTAGNKKYELEDGAKVFLPIAGTTYHGSPDKVHNGIAGIVYRENGKGHRTDMVFFNLEDLELTY